MHALASTEQTFTRANFPKGFHFWYLNRSFSGVIPDQIVHYIIYTLVRTDQFY